MFFLARDYFVFCELIETSLSRAKLSEKRRSSFFFLLYMTVMGRKSELPFFVFLFFGGGVGGVGTLTFEKDIFGAESH